MMFHLEGCSSRCFSCPLHGTGIDNHTHQDTLHWYIDIFDMYWYIDICLCITYPGTNINSGLLDIGDISLTMFNIEWEILQVYWWGKTQTNLLPMVIDHVGDVTRTLPCWSPEFQCECPPDLSPVTDMAHWDIVHTCAFDLLYIKDCTYYVSCISKIVRIVTRCALEMEVPIDNGIDHLNTRNATALWPSSNHWRHRSHCRTHCHHHRKPPLLSLEEGEW